MEVSISHVEYGIDFYQLPVGLRKLFFNKSETFVSLPYLVLILSLPFRTLKNGPPEQGGQLGEQQLHDQPSAILLQEHTILNRYRKDVK